MEKIEQVNVDKIKTKHQVIPTYYKHYIIQTIFLDEVLCILQIENEQSNVN